MKNSDLGGDYQHILTVRDYRITKSYYHYQISQAWNQSQLVSVQDGPHQSLDQPVLFLLVRQDPLDVWQLVLHRRLAISCPTPAYVLTLDFLPFQNSKPASPVSQLGTVVSTEPFGTVGNGFLNALSGLSQHQEVHDVLSFGLKSLGTLTMTIHGVVDGTREKIPTAREGITVHFQVLIRIWMDYQQDTEDFTASKIFHSSGKQKGQWTPGNGVSQPHTREIGASRLRKHLDWIMAVSSPATPPEIGASCVIRQRPVFFTDSMRVQESQGQMVWRSIISHSIPSFQAISATFLRVTIRFPYPIRVISLPFLTTSALCRANSQSPTGTSASAFLQSALGQKKITGLGSLIAANNNPLAWMGSLGTMTLSPGVWAKYAYGDWEWYNPP